MPLADIITKEPTIATPSAATLVNSPQEWESKFQYHVSTYIAIADMESRWDEILKNLLSRKSATGLIYADTGYGKTSAGASLWKYAESKGIVTVPPFIWNSLADMLIATHGWVSYRLQHTRPELKRDLEERYQGCTQVAEEILAQRIAHKGRLNSEYVRTVIAHLKTEGRLLAALSPQQLLDYLRFATENVLKAGYKGLLILPDEFELFKGNPDTAQNYNQLKDFIFGVHGEEKLPLGCVAFTYNQTHADISISEKHILARFNKPEGSLIPLEQFYGQTEFAKTLWAELAKSCQLSADEKQAIDAGVLTALGQFLRHPRARELMSGPRSVVQTFRQAARHYTEKNAPYSPLDFCEDYLSGNITYGSQETEAAQAHTQIMELGIISNDARKRLVKLLCIYPEGIPEKVCHRYGISDSERKDVFNTLLGTHVITKLAGPALLCYRDDLLGVDKLNEILQQLKYSFNAKDREFHRNAVTAFTEHVIPQILIERKQGELVGWSDEKNQARDMIAGENFGLHATRNLKGTVLRNYPHRTLTVDIGTNNQFAPLSSDSHLHIRFILEMSTDTSNSCTPQKNGFDFQFNMQTPINPREIPADIGKLGDLFSPEAITPLLLLSILHFFDEESTIEMVESEKQETQVNSLKGSILNEVINYFFSPQVAALATDSAGVSAGRGLLEGALKILIPKLFPKYKAVAVFRGWQKHLAAYRDTLHRETTLAKKRGREPIKRLNQEVPKLFNIGQILAFSNFYNNSGQHLLRIDEIDEFGNTARRRIKPSNSKKPVHVYFTLHPLEKYLVRQLEKSTDTITIDGKQSKTMELRSAYREANELGYLDEEIKALIDILKERGVLDKQRSKGAEYLYFVEKFIDFAELKTKLGKLEADVAYAKSKGFVYESKALSEAQVLASTIGIETDEVQKDTLRQHLNSVKENLGYNCAQWFERERKHLGQKYHELETCRTETPGSLDRKTGYPLTEFSQILFQDIQPRVKSAYTEISNQIQKIQNEIRQNCNKALDEYEGNMTPENAVNTAARLQNARSRVDTEITRLRQRGEDAQELFKLFESWRFLAKKVGDDRQRMVEMRDDTAVEDLIERFRGVELRIRQSLADNRERLEDVLGNYELFKKQITEIKAEFEQVVAGKEDAFIAYQRDIEKRLRAVQPTLPKSVAFNSSDSDGCYRDVRENAVNWLQNLINQVLNESGQRKRELLKPIKLFNVPDILKKKAIQLRKDIGELDKDFQAIRSELRVEEVTPKLGEWIEKLEAKFKEAKTISQRRIKLEHEIDELSPELSPKAKMLREQLKLTTDFTELVVQLLDEESFNSAKEILESLEELYQANLVNMTVQGR